MIQVTDIDGNVYDTVQIGNQLWLAENLKVTKFRNGDSIAEYQSGQWYQPDLIRRIPSDPLYPGYGQYYNLAAIQDSREIAPKGCRIPTLSDMNELRDYTINVYGGLEGAMNALRSTRVEPTAFPRWEATPYTPNNGTGFSGLPGHAIPIANLNASFEGYGIINAPIPDKILDLPVKAITTDTVFFLLLSVSQSSFTNSIASITYNAGSMIYFFNVRCLLDTKIIMMQ